CVSNAWYLLQPILRDQPVNRNGGEREIVGRPAVGPRPVRIVALQLHAQTDLTKQIGDLRGVQSGHVFPTAQATYGSPPDLPRLRRSKRGLLMCNDRSRAI